MKNKNQIVFDAEPTMRTIDSNGYMHVKLTPISKACVNPYLGSEIPNYKEKGLKPDGIYYALRDPDELKKAVDTFNGLPLLLDHHKINAEYQDKKDIVGSTGTDATFDGTYLKNSLSITDADAIKAIEDGTAREISCAYAYEPDFTAGEFEGVPYDFVMRNIKGNHVALVAEGRAGHDVKVADSNEKIKEKLKMAKENEDKKKKQQGKANDSNPTPETNEVPTPEPTQGENPPAVENSKAKEPTTTTESTGDEEPATPTINKDSDDYKAGFADGMAAAKGNDGGEKEVTTVTGDSLEKVKEQAKQEAFAHMKDLSKAARDCEFILGRQDAMAFDSALDIYKLALKTKGYDSKDYSQETCEGMIKVLKDNAKKEGIANDSNIELNEELPEELAGLLG